MFGWKDSGSFSRDGKRTVFIDTVHNTWKVFLNCRFMKRSIIGLELFIKPHIKAGSQI